MQREKEMSEYKVNIENTKRYASDHCDETNRKRYYESRELYPIDHQNQTNASHRYFI